MYQQAPLNVEDIVSYRTSLLDYSKYMFDARKGVKNAFVENWHHVELCNALERVVAGYTKRLVINMPPRYSKTELAVVKFLSWGMGNFPDAEFIHASYSARLAAKNASEARQDMEHEAYRAIFGKPAFRRDTNAKDEYRTAAGGCVYATGSGGSITGYGAGKMRETFGGAIVIDDPHKAGEATSDTMRKNVIDWFSTTMESRKNSEDTPIIVIMQRLHQEDLAGWLLAGNNGETWEHLNLPAIGPDGSPLWEFKHDIEALNRMQQANPYVFAGQYMQQPAPLSGGLIKPDMISIYDSAPQMIAVVRGWDLAASKDSGDYTAGVLIGLDANGTFWILDVVRDRVQADGVERLIVSTASRDTGMVSQSLPQDPGQAGKSQVSYLSRKLIGANFNFSLESGDKATRAMPFASQVNVGNVNMLRAPWNKALIDELRLFPNGSFDDQVDGCSRAFNAVSNSSINRFKALS